jgi:CCR4-NOT transcription complex subunit 9
MGDSSTNSLGEGSNIIAGLSLPSNFGSGSIGPNIIGSRLTPDLSGSSAIGGLPSLSSVLGGQQQQQQQQLHQQQIGFSGLRNNFSMGNNTMIGGAATNLGGLSSNNNPQQLNMMAINGTLSSLSANPNIDELHLLVLQLINPEQRESVLLELSKKRESFPDLAPILWHTFGTVASLLQEIVSIYPLLTPPTLTAHASNRVCNALALLQCVASHPDTRGLFLSAHVPLYLYPFLNTQSKSRPFEYLRLTSLGVIGALVKMDDADVINFLLQTEIIPLCLRIMEAGSELSKTVATFIVQKILLDEIGLSYVCATAERFYAVSTVLNNMIECLVTSPSVRLLKHIVRCYLRLSDNARARDALRQALPSSLRDNTFAEALRDDVTVKKWLSQLLGVVGSPVEGGGAGGGMMQGAAGGLGGVSSMAGAGTVDG